MTSLPVDEVRVAVRPIRPDDHARLARMFHRLSRTTYYRRFFGPPPPAPRSAVLHHLSILDHDRREALVAIVGDEIVGVARYDRLPGRADEAEIAVLVEDGWQGRGVGSFLLRRLAHVAVDRGIERFVADVLTENTASIRLLRSLGGASVRLEGTGYDRHAVVPLVLDGRHASAA